MLLLDLSKGGICESEGKWCISVSSSVINLNFLQMGRGSHLRHKVWWNLWYTKKPQLVMGLQILQFDDADCTGKLLFGESKLELRFCVSPQAAHLFEICCFVDVGTLTSLSGSMLFFLNVPPFHCCKLGNVSTFWHFAALIVLQLELISLQVYPSILHRFKVGVRF